MNFFDLVNISEKYMELLNPFTPEKIVTIGEFLELKEGQKVIEFGSGYGEVLVLWAKYFGIRGIGVEVREPACERAVRKIEDRGLDNKLQIICQNGADYKFEKESFDVAACIGASFIWKGYRNTIKAMKEAMKAGGKLVIGEPYWRTSRTPPEYVKRYQDICTETEILHITREEGFDLMYEVRSSIDDWDRYESGNWYGLTRWIDENPDHPEREQVIHHLHHIQDDYMQYGREFMGWAIYILNPKKY